MVFPDSSVGKESARNVGNLGSIPGLGRSLGEGKGYPRLYSTLENSMFCMVHEVAKSWTQLSDFHIHLTQRRNLLEESQVAWRIIRNPRVQNWERRHKQMIWEQETQYRHDWRVGLNGTCFWMLLLGSTLSLSLHRCVFHKNSQLQIGRVNGPSLRLCSLSHAPDVGRKEHVDFFRF